MGWVPFVAAGVVLVLVLWVLLLVILLIKLEIDYLNPNHLAQTMPVRKPVIITWVLNTEQVVRNRTHRKLLIQNFSKNILMDMKTKTLNLEDGHHMSDVNVKINKQNQ